MSQYALYKGDEFIDLGTKEELSERNGISPNTIMFYTTPTYRRRIQGKEDKRFIVVRLEE